MVFSHIVDHSVQSRAESDHLIDGPITEVRPDATRKEVRQAVELLFDVKVERVTAVNVPGKAKRRGPSRGRRADWKKAYVRVASGQELDYMVTD